MGKVAVDVLKPAVMRETMSQFASGVTIVTSLDDAGAPVGCTVSAFSSLSLDPPLVLVCIGKDREMARWLTAGAGFVVNILLAEQVELALSFGRRDLDRFLHANWSPGRNGLPLLNGVLAQIECILESVEQGGDHWIFVGRVVKATVNPGTPLLYAQGAFGRGIGPKPSEPVDIPSSEWLVSAPW